MIKLTNSSGKIVYVNFDSIQIVEECDQVHEGMNTSIDMKTCNIIVQESPEEVVRLIVKANHRKIMSEELYKLYFSTAKDYKEIEKTFQDVFTKMVENEMP